MNDEVDIPEYNFDSAKSEDITLLIDKIKKVPIDEESEYLSYLESDKTNIKRKYYSKDNKNRYSDICPYSHNRVLLNQKKDYINASWINVFYLHRYLNKNFL